MRGKDQRHADDVMEDGSLPPPRKCPRILNDWTQAQPHIDKNNRFRQFELAIEERFRTKSFPYRLFTTVIAGMSITNAYVAYNYHIGQEYDSFIEFASAVAYDAMTNNYDELHAPNRGSPSSRATPAPSSSTARAFFTNDDKEHAVVPIRTIAGWNGARQQKCRVCHKLCTTCCLSCSDAQSIVPVHPVESKSQGVVKRWPCLQAHKRRPDALGRTTASASRSAAAKRRRK